MTDDSHLIDASDLAPRRFRSFVARPSEALPPAGHPGLAGGDNDIPLLTEIVEVRAAPRQNFAALLDALRDEIDSEVSAWLVNELPAAVANASQQILEELDSKARNTLLPRLHTLLEAQRGSAGEPGDPTPSL